MSDTFSLPDVSKGIKYWRTRKGLTQAELARIIGKSVRQLQFYESGSTYPSSDILNAIADALDVEISALSTPLSDAGTIEPPNLGNVFVQISRLLDYEELGCSIEYSEQDDLSYSVKFSPKSTHAHELGWFLEHLVAKRSEFDSYLIDRGEYERWIDVMNELYKGFPLTLKDRPPMTKLQELEFQKRKIDEEIAAWQRQRDLENFIKEHENEDNIKDSDS